MTIDVFVKPETTLVKLNVMVGVVDLFTLPVTVMVLVLKLKETVGLAEKFVDVLRVTAVVSEVVKVHDDMGYADPLIVP